MFRPIDHRLNQLSIHMKKLQKLMVTTSSILMVLAAVLFVIAVLFRNILRIISRDHLHLVKLCTDFVLCAGFLPILDAALSCAVSIWELQLCLYSAIVVKGLLMIFEGITIALICILELNNFVSPSKIHYAWYLWECLDFGSCISAYNSYCHTYLIPIAVLLLLILIIQMSNFLFLIRIIQCMNLKIKALTKTSSHESLAQNVQTSQL